MPSSKDKYTDPKLRDEVKEDIQQSDEGGAPGQWSARKAQMMAREYKSRGGGYKTDKRDQGESHKHLTKWTEEERQTEEGLERYEEKANDEGEVVHEKKEEPKATKEDGKQETQSLSNKQGNNETMQSDPDPQQQEHPSNHTKRGQASQKPGQNRVRGQDAIDGEAADHPKKKQKDQTGTPKIQRNGTSVSVLGRVDAPAQPASKSRPPKEGQRAYWKTTSAWTEGSVVEVLRGSKKVDGKQVKATKADPCIVLKSNSAERDLCAQSSHVYFE
ncbi:uncharacterized protein PV07_02717 [Cladophialophora immunda]|uniref:Hypervirulence associated protein TUDOR domain-containing protein n=1 Tax=Cladophialophora immunda TaxID=569365 RepID=A0A0D2CIV1_9EURO|nr:uncharacterized protein PV07_02717 [Cladophialophora immunda]KIW31033.1 hypothetical protein PV07_02717 [Cladophialophora immunda]OQV05903.1 hypothetical protein CLAIMM_10559 [Cladophialophora immunda]